MTVSRRDLHDRRQDGLVPLSGIDLDEVGSFDGGRFAEVYAAATVALPLLMKAVFEQCDR